MSVTPSSSLYARHPQELYKCPFLLESYPASMSDNESSQASNPRRRLRDDALQLGPRKKMYVPLFCCSDPS